MIFTNWRKVWSSRVLSESIKCIRREPGPLAEIIPISPATPKIDSAEVVASRGCDGSIATKAVMRAVTEQPVALIFCNIGKQLLKVRNLL
ncbi:hypothetical protein LIER_35753 [Lithospermum erythrorhizon]|uniref:Uncharacterized protein n=1 Tax=Lithospermum erythrorhizon TaxID=34254 RepID=A0AAV3NVX7_LITER